MARLSARGQIAVQLPSDDYNSARTIFADVAGWRYEMGTLDIGAYAELLFAAGLGDLDVFEKIYPHVLADADAMLEWAKGTALLPYLERLPPAQPRPTSRRYGDGCTRAIPSGRCSSRFDGSSFMRGVRRMEMEGSWPS